MAKKNQRQRKQKVDKDKVADRLARLEQRLVLAAKTPDAIVSAPVIEGFALGQSSFSVANKSQSSIVVKGRECIGQLNNTTSLSGLISLNPYSVGKRLPILAQLYEQFKFLNWRLTWAPACQTTIGANVILDCDFDPTDGVFDMGVATSLPSVMSQRGAAMGPAWRPLSVSFSATKEEKKLWFCDPSWQGGEADLRQTVQAVMHCYNANINSGVIGYLVFDYECLLVNPQVEPSTSAAPSAWGQTVNASDFSGFARGTAWSTSSNIWSHFTAVLGDVVEVINQNPIAFSYQSTTSAGGQAITMNPGERLYATLLDNGGTNNWFFFPDFTSALAGVTTAGAIYAAASNNPSFTAGWLFGRRIGNRAG